jgi:starvation-inducible DNA-binding protein
MSSRSVCARRRHDDSLSGHIARLRRLSDNETDSLAPNDMLAELREDNLSLIQSLRETHELCDESGDVATASLIENWVDEAEGRVWYLREAIRDR